MHYYLQIPGHRNRTSHVDPWTLQREPKPPIAIDAFWDIYHDEDDKIAIVAKMDAWDVLSPDAIPHLVDFKRSRYQLLRQKIEDQFKLSSYATLQDARAVLGKYPGQDVDEETDAKLAEAPVLA